MVNGLDFLVNTPLPVYLPLDITRDQDPGNVKAVGVLASEIDLLPGLKLPEKRHVCEDR